MLNLTSMGVVDEYQPEKLTTLDLSVLTREMNFGSGSRERLINETFVDELEGEAIWQPDVYHEAVRVANRLCIKNIIDFGCGNGKKLIHYTTDTEIRPVGVDFNGSLHAARSYFPNSEWFDASLIDTHSLLQIRKSLQERLPAIIILSDVIEHLPDIRPILAFIRELIATDPRSYVLISTPDRERQNRSDPTIFPPNRAHVREWTRAELVTLIANAGFEISRAGWTRCHQWDEYFTTVFIQAGYDANRHLQRLRNTFGAPPTWFPEHLLISPTIEEFETLGNSSTFIVEQQKNYGADKSFLLTTEGFFDFYSKQCNFAVTLNDLLGGPLNAKKPFEDLVLDAVECALFSFPCIKTVEFQDYQGVGSRVAQAKRAGIISGDLTVVAHCYGNLHNLNGEHAEGIQEHDRIGLMEKISIENADVVCFPSQFLHDLYSEIGISIDRFKSEIRRPPLHRLAETTAEDQRIDTLVFYGKKNKAGGYKLFLDTLNEKGLGSLTLAGVTQIVIIGPTISKTAEWDDAIEALRWHFNVLEQAVCSRTEFIACLRTYAPRSIIIAPHTGRNYPLFVLDLIAAGGLPVLIDAGSIPEILPPEFVPQLLTKSEPKALRAKIDDILGLSQSELSTMRQGLANARNIRQGLINSEAKAPFKPLSRDTIRQKLKAAVVIPFFNTPIGALNDVIWSLACQSRLPDEVIIVNAVPEPSAITTLAEISQGAAKALSIRIVPHFVDGELASIRNAALAETVSDVLINLSGEDVALNTFVADIVGCLEANPDVDAAMPYLAEFDENANFEIGELNGRIYRPYGDGLIASQTQNILGHANSGFRVNRLREMGGWSSASRTSQEDNSVHMCIISRNGRIAIIPRISVLNRIALSHETQPYDDNPHAPVVVKGIGGLPRFEVFRLHATLHELASLKAENLDITNRTAKIEKEIKLINEIITAQGSRAEDSNNVSDNIFKTLFRLRAEIDVERRRSNQFSENIKALRSENCKISKISEKENEVNKLLHEKYESRINQAPTQEINKNFYLIQFPRIFNSRRLASIFQSPKMNKIRNQWRKKPIEQTDRLLVQNSGLFDFGWYAARNPDLGQIDLLEHYLAHGGREGRAASPSFDSSLYLSANPDVAATDINPLVHYLRHGIHEGRAAYPMNSTQQGPTTLAAAEEDNRWLVQNSGLFDSGWYAARNPDLGQIDLLEHYLAHGGREGRAASPSFDSHLYLSDNPDVAASGINPLVHYLRHGVHEGRAAYSINSTQQRPTALSAAEEHDRWLVQNSGLFDSGWYAARNPDLGQIDLLEHYIEHGGREGRAAGPSFDSRWYLSTNPDIAADDMNPLVHYLRYGIQEGRLPRYPIKIIENLRFATEDFSKCEPEIAREFTADRFEQLQHNQSIRTTKLNRIWSRIFGELHRAYDRLIFVPWLTRGGADLVAANAARSVVELQGNHAVLVIVTDFANVEARDWIPPTADLIVLSEYDHELSHDERVRIVEMLIFAISPKSVLNVNSRACWDAFSIRGKALANIASLYVTLFCRDYDVDGRARGYADTHFTATLPVVTKVYIDNEAFIEELATKNRLPPQMKERLQFLPQPILPAIRRFNLVSRDENSDFRVIWSGRLTRQKNVSLLCEIIAQAPHIQFDIYGDGEGPEAEKLFALERSTTNLKLLGPFSSIEELPVDKYVAYLFTSLWEGTPTTLINIAARGLPIVASNVGGVGEIINDGTGWLIQDINNPGAYVSALNEIFQQPDEAAKRVEALVEHVCFRHSWASYMEAFRTSPSFLM